MALQALGTPTIYFPDPTYASFALPTQTAYTGAAFGLTFVNYPAGLVALFVTTTGASTITITAANKLETTAFSAVALVAGGVSLLGPFDPVVYSDINGLVHVTFGTNTDVSFALAVILPAQQCALTYRAVHNPFEATSGATDF